MKSKILIICILVAGVGGCSYVNKKIGIDDDGPMEQILEAIIKDQLDLEIDLTPYSPEK